VAPVCRFRIGCRCGSTRSSAHVALAGDLGAFGVAEHHALVAAQALGDLHGLDGLEQRVVQRRGARLPLHHADRERQGHLHVGQRDRRLEGLQHRLHALLGGGGTFAEDGHELVATEARQHGHLHQRLAQAPSGAGQQRVRGALAQGVVVHLEVVQVEQGHGVGGALVGRIIRQCGGELLQRAPVRQRCEPVHARVSLALRVVA